jgi:predicted ribosome quality control (RQC) complex YloA/Tae2 family protein
MLLKVGRHIRPNDNFKMIVGREEGENKFMEGYKKQFIWMRSPSHRGPLVLIDGDANDDDLLLASRIAARFGKGKMAEQVDMEINYPGGEQKVISVAPMLPDEMKQEWSV